MATGFRKYSVRKDKKNATRIWQECGWVSEEKKELEAMDQFIKVSTAWVYEMDGAAEALSLATPGRFLHTDTELPLAAITAVTTSRVARNQGAASGTLARLLAHEARGGAVVSGLGIFEQGFYNRLGYGNGPYEHWVRFDPAWLEDMGRPRVPVRLGKDDWAEVHKARFERRKKHGATDLIPAEITKSEMAWMKNVFGLGYRENDRLTHFFYAYADEVEEGPYTIAWMVYRSLEEFKELLALIRGLGDQVRQVRMREPRGIQTQSLLRKPFQLQHVSGGSKNESRARAIAYWQLRILDLPACISAVVSSEPLELNLNILDPIEDLVPSDSAWSGCAGAYTVSFGKTSSLQPGTTPELPTLTATINDFTRFWMGAATAEVLAGLGSFAGPPELIETLDRCVRIPSPDPDWDY